MQTYQREVSDVIRRQLLLHFHKRRNFRSVVPLEPLDTQHAILLTNNGKRPQNPLSTPRIIRTDTVTISKALMLNLESFPPSAIVNTV